MNEIELTKILIKGEDSKHQFKKNITNVDSLSQEFVAFSNSAGGRLFVGVDDDGNITGLTSSDVKRLNQMISNAASQSVKPSINPITETMNTNNGKIVMVIDVLEGLNKPYMDNNGQMWVKSGADKRKVTAREEMQRLFSQSNLIYADEIPVNNSNVTDINLQVFTEFFSRRYKQDIDETGLSMTQILQNLNLAHNEILNLAGILLFSKDPQKFRPVFMIKACLYPGIDFEQSEYGDSEDINGTLTQQYERSLAFIKRNLHHIQGNQGVNSLGIPEIPVLVLEEILVNALVHRDYFISAPIRIFIFKDRVEIISPGHLPNHLTSEHIKFGLSNIRNPVLMSHAVHLLPYRGLGSGIPRATKAYPDIKFRDDRSGNQFIVIIPRKIV